MRAGPLAILVAFALSACVTAPATPAEQAAYWGPIPDAPSREELAAAPLLTDHVWVQRPNGRDYVMMYPRDAWLVEAQSNVTLDCIVQSEGWLACAARGDGTRFDFEEAARRISTRFQLDVPGRGVSAVVGHRVELQVWFRIGG